MSERRDLALSLAAAAMLLLALGPLAQCRSARPVSEPVLVPTATTRIERNAEERERRGAERQSAEHEEEERAKIRAVANALRTLAADPTAAATYGLRP